MPSAAPRQISHLPPTAALFGAFLGYNPIQQLLPPPVLAALTAANRNVLLGKEFFPNLISAPFMDGLHATFYISAGLCVIAAVASFLRGGRTPFPQDEFASGAVASGNDVTTESASTIVLEPSK